MLRSDRPAGPGDSYGRRPLRSLLPVGAALAALLVLFTAGEFLQRSTFYRAMRRVVLPLDPEEFAGLAPPPFSWAEPVRQILLDTYLLLPRPRSDRALLESGLPVYDLRLPPKSHRALRRTAELVTARRVASGIPRPFVPGDFKVDGEWVRVKVKLRGLTALHYIPARPSLRVRFPPLRPLRGMRDINLSDPYDKGLTADEVANWELKRYGILTWESGFVVLRVNGEVVGLFQEIEHFGRRLIERANRAEGYIFGGTGQLFGKEGFGYDKARAAFERLRGCLERQDQGPDSECGWKFLDDYFDTDKLAWAAAYTTLVGSSHGWAPDNLRLYYDPARGTFEPIPWDYFFSLTDPSAHPDGEAYTGGYGRLFSDIPEFRRMRDKRLWTLLSERAPAIIERANQRFAELTEPLKYDSRHPDFDRDQQLHDDFIRALSGNRDLLVGLFSRDDLRVTYHCPDRGRLVVGFENHSKSFIEIEDLMPSSGSRDRGRLLGTSVIVDGAWNGNPGRRLIEVNAPPGCRLEGVQARNGVTGEPVPDSAVTMESDAQRLVALQEASADFSDGEPIPLPDLPANVRVRDDRITFGPGAARLDRSLEIPEAYETVFEPGLSLQVADGAALLIRGDLTSLGTVQRPILVTGESPAKAWGAIAVQGRRTRPARVRLAHTTLEGGRGAQNERTYFTGALAVHDGDVTLSNSRFTASRADDGINLKYCRIRLEGNEFSGAETDAIDLDFCTGTVTRNRIVGPGGDCLDLSGSDVSVSQNRIERCGDKGVSVGEATRTEIRDNLILESRTGVAVKDGSNALVAYTGMAGLRVGVAAFVKKPSFGPGRARLERVALYDVESALQRDPASQLEVSASALYVSAGTSAGEPAWEGLQILPVRPAMTPDALDRLLTAAEARQRPWGVRRALELPR